MLPDIARIRLRRIKAGSLFKLVFLATSAVFCPMFLFFGILALFGAKTVTVSGSPVTGIMGLVAALIMAPLFSVIFSLFGWIGSYIGIRIWGHFKPITLEYVPAGE
ncbi:hypothetical protein PXH66_00100 [Synoicihabitans lomoniglobus]|uniref:Uncharacterized protein n=1 Tax=Synoicihabitans lomoniglobus TaxID=2909285 RepID=A0AAF0CPK7_9BACT|nr:hypothetical protein PXH66_00100 [Opitutaceae bacterium LMO-M01]